MSKARIASYSTGLGEALGAILAASRAHGGLSLPVVPATAGYGPTTGQPGPVKRC